MASTVESKSKLRIAFFELLFGNQEGFLCICSSNPDAPKSQFKQKFFAWPKESLKVENYILAQEIKHNVYFCINLLRNAERRKKQALPSNLIWADLDEINPDRIPLVPPPIVIQSSPGRWQAFWRCTTTLESYDSERYSRRIAYAIGADRSGWDLTQLFRVPFTTNFKYDPPVSIKLEKALETMAPVALFEGSFEAPPEEDPTDLPNLAPESQSDPNDIVAAYRDRLDFDRFFALYTQEPAEDADWSKALWSLEVMCMSAGMTPEETFVVAKNAACNKYARDGRPVEHLWRDVMKASEEYGKLPPERELLEMPHLVDEPASETFLDIYKDWACEATDAVPEFHELSAMILLSSIVASSLRLETSYGPIAPNLWGLVLGDSTVTRKSTSMKMAVDLLTSIEPELILATDGSVEGLLSGLEGRPNKVSVFFRDEVSGLFDSMNKRDYLSSMPETLAHLYDVPPVYSRLLRKEVIRIESPAFIFFGGGIIDRVYQNVSENWIESGFIPRFLIVAGDFDQEGMRPTGPPTEVGIRKRAQVAVQLADLYENYATEVPQKIGNSAITMHRRVMATMTDAAWIRYQAIESKLTVEGYNSLIRNTALPTFDRLGRSILKMGMIFAATRQQPDEVEKIVVEESDIVNAAWYAQKWGQHSVNLILSSGKAPREKYIDRVYRKIANNPGILRSTMMQHMHLMKKETDDIISTLEDRGQIRYERSGKATRYWVT